MSVLDEIKRMQQQGTAEDQIVRTLREKGVDYKVIYEGLSQSKIRSAVEDSEQIQATQGMQPSMMEQPTEEYTPTPPAPVQQYDQYQYQQEYQYPSSGLSTDTITEISEQIVSEKMSEVRKSLEKVIDFKSSVEARMEYLDERLKRLEKIIDTLQASVLRKVGDFMNNVQDIKNELIETQKTFTKVIPEMRKESKDPKSMSRYT